MTTAFIEQNFAHLDNAYLSVRAENVARVWPEVRTITDENFFEELVKASAKLYPGVESSRHQANGRTILTQLQRSSHAKRGFEIAAQFSAAAKDEELLKISLIGPERIAAINLALNALRRE